MLIRPAFSEGYCTSLLIIFLLTLSATAYATEDKANHSTNLLWGDLHVHSNLSFDAYSFGNRTLSPDEAFRFARGQTIAANGGQQAKLQRPLDFLMVSDHAEYMGVMRELMNGNKMLLNATFAKRWQRLIEDGDMAAVVGEFSGSIEKTNPHTNVIPENFASSIWREVNSAAQNNNKPGEFTAFIGYEWTSMITGRNLHRNVVLRDGPETTLRHRPFSSIEGNDPEMLWNHLQQYESDTGGQSMSIPHNGNLSDGLMFSESRINGEAISTDYARKRARWEPIYEVTQVKGDSESHPLLSPKDPFADFENWDETDIAMKPRDPQTMKASLAQEYARPALKSGLRIAKQLGANPFQFGMIGSTDSHTSLATADSDNFYGKFLDSEPSVARLSNKMGGALWENRKLTASGYAAVWAKTNTRADIFDALARREVYASTGPRIAVRFFGGWAFDEAILSDPEFAIKAYAGGVPMGGVLRAKTARDKAPVFLLSASKDPEGANLDRIQIIKGWLTSEGETRETVYDAVWSNNREIINGTLTALPSTVNLKTGRYANTVGSVSLATLWQDPDFDAAQQAFYYLRVLQIETPRWTTYDAARYGVEPPVDIAATLSERAYTSPIWYTPGH